MKEFILKCLTVTFCISILIYCFYPRYEAIKDSNKIARFDHFYGEYEIIGSDMQWIRVTNVGISCYNSD